MDKTYIGRLAPSPTGLLHLGHAATFWQAFTRAREHNALAIRTLRQQGLSPAQVLEMAALSRWQPYK